MFKFNNKHLSFTLILLIQCKSIRFLTDSSTGVEILAYAWLISEIKVKL